MKNVFFFRFGCSCLKRETLSIKTKEEDEEEEEREEENIVWFALFSLCVFFLNVILINKN